MSKKIDEQGIGNGLSIVRMETSPAARYSQATLLKALEDNGCGRPSTFATIIETVLSTTRNYSKLDDKKKIVPSELGMQLSAFLDRAFPDLINLTYTKDMEKDLDLIAEGKMTKLEFLNKFYNDLETAVKNNKEVNADPTAGYPEKTCPVCGKPMVVRRARKTGKLFYGCSGYPKCKHIEGI